MGTTEELEQKYGLLFPHLNERQQHLVAAVDAQQLGRGVLPASPILPDSLVRPSIGLSRALLNHLSALSEYGTLELDGRRWSSMTPNWSKRWKL
jgi:hypothetical protein